VALPAHTDEAGDTKMPEVTACSIKEAARQTGLSRSFLYKEMKAGRLPILKIGKRRLVQSDDVAAYLRAHRQGGQLVAV
jgi:excisionase family DNA binding protein